MADTKAEGEARIDVLGEASFAFHGDAHHVVTFLNKTLKYRNLIFGLTQNASGAFNLRIYEVIEATGSTEGKPVADCDESAV